MGSAVVHLARASIGTESMSVFYLQALIDGKVLCVHGGLSPDIRTLDQVRQAVFLVCLYSLYADAYVALVLALVTYLSVEDTGGLEWEWQCGMQGPSKANCHSLQHCVGSNGSQLV